MTVRIGWIGLGRMGEAMAKRLVKAGNAVCVWNRTASKAAPLAEAGATIVGSKQELADAIQLLDSRGVSHGEIKDLGEGMKLYVLAIRDPDLVESAAKAYPKRIVVALDARNGIVATDAWRDASGRRAVDLARQLAALPIAAILYTDIDRDGMEVGPNVDETARLAKDGGVNVIASGGVGTLEHLGTLAAAHPRIVGAIVGRALHERRFTLEQAVEAAETP